VYEYICARVVERESGNSTQIVTDAAWPAS